ncbi:phage tail tape measure protein, partial [bacterium]|nr:phage tail tape measure protein [bacterium]
MSIDPVILQLKAEVDQYQANLTKAQRHSDAKLDAIEKRGAKMGQSLKAGFDMAKGAAIAFAGALVMEKLGQAISQGLEYASSLGEVSQQLGVTTDALQEYRYAATQAGLSQDEMDQALAQLTRRAGEAASGTKAQAEAFEKLGISVRTANNEMIPTGDLIPMIADGLQKIESPAQRAAILMDLFGKSGQKLEPLLSGGSAAINNLRNAAYELGIVLSSQQIQNADDTADKLAAVKTVLEANIAGAVANNTGAIIALANALGQIVVMAGRAAEAFRRFKLSQGLAQEEAKISSWFTSEKDRAQSIRNANAYRAEIAKMDGTQDKTGGFRDYNAAPIPGFTPGKKGGAAMPAAGVASAGGLGKVKGAGGGVGGGPTGPSAAEIQNRLDGQLASYAQQAISAMQSVATSTEEKADLELRSVELARIRMLAEIKADDHYS